MLYVDYEKFMLDIQSELNIQLPEYDLYSGYFDDKNFISCNRKTDSTILMEVSIDHNENYSKNTVIIKIPFEIIDNKTCLNYPIKNKNIMDVITTLNEYYPVFYKIQIEDLPAYLAANGFETSQIIIKAELILTTNLKNEIIYMLDNIHFDFVLFYKSNYHQTMNAQSLFNTIDTKLKSNYYLNSDDYINLSMPERVQLYNIAEQLKKSLILKKE